MLLRENKTIAMHQCVSKSTFIFNMIHVLCIAAICRSFTGDAPESKYACVGSTHIPVKCLHFSILNQTNGSGFVSHIINIYYSIYRIKIPARRAAIK